MSARNADRRTPHNAVQRRLVMIGSLLAAAARGQTIVAPELVDAWDSTVDALRADLVKVRNCVIHAHVEPPLVGCRCPRCTS